MKPEAYQWFVGQPGHQQNVILELYRADKLVDPGLQIGDFLDREYNLAHPPRQEPPQVPIVPPVAYAAGYQNFFVRDWGNGQQAVVANRVPAPGGRIEYRVGEPADFPPQPVPFYPEKEEPDEMPKEWKTLNDFKVGTDPEFVCLDANGRGRYIGGELNHGGPVGYDHGGRIAEFRPAPSMSTWRLVQNIWRLANDPAKTNGIEAYKWRAGAICGNEVLGGHVHLDIKYEHPGAQTPEFVERINALDRLTLQLEELDILPKNESRKRRELGHRGNAGDIYGAFGNIRPAGHKPRVEYRTPASWLYSPKTAFAVLTAYKLAAKEPKTALEILTKEPSSIQMKRFLRTFKSADDDARMLDEKFLSVNGLKSVRGDVDADCRKTWEQLPA